MVVGRALVRRVDAASCVVDVVLECGLGGCGECEAGNRGEGGGGTEVSDVNGVCGQVVGGKCVCALSLGGGANGYLQGGGAVMCS